MFVEDPDKRSVSQAHKYFPLSSVWDLSPEMYTRAYFSNPNNSASGTTYPHYWAKCFVQRRPEFFIWNAALPIGALTSMAFGAFTVPWTDIADRFSVTLTLLLTLVAYKLVISTSLPQVSYLTLLDKYRCAASRRPASQVL